MKKHLLSLFAMASMLFASSCTSEEVISQSTGNEVKVTFTTEMRNDVKSRAVGDDTDNVDQLIFAVYDKEGNELPELRQSTHMNDDEAKKTITLTSEENKKKATIEVVLVKGQTYSFAFWAQKKGHQAYSFNPENAKVSIDYQAANDKSADAFFASVNDYKVTGTFEKNVTLKRPFAQVNFLTTAQDLKNAAKSNFVPSQTQIVVEKAATELNVLDGTVGNNMVTATFNLANLVGHDLENATADERVKIKKGDKYVGFNGTSFPSVDTENGAEPFIYLATAYFLPTEATATTTIDASMLVKATGKDDYSLSVSGIQAQRNYRTNIYGNLLTSNGTFYVTVDPGFADGNHDYSNELGDEFVTLANLTSKLNANKANATPYNYTVDCENGNNIEIVIPTETLSSSLTFNLKNVDANSTITFKDQNSSTPFENTIILQVEDGLQVATLNVEMPGAHFVVNNGTYAAVNAATSSSTLVIGGGASVGTLTVNQGNVEIKTEGLVDEIAKGDNNTNSVIVYLEEGATKPEVKDENVGVVFSEEETSTGIYTINLDSDLELGNSTLFLDKNTVINGNGFAVKSSATRVFRVTQSNIEVTLNDVNMVSRTVMQYPNDVRGISIDPNLQNIKLTLKNSSLDFTDASACDWAYAVNVSGNGTGHTVTVNGGTYEGANVINVHGAKNTITVKNATLNCLYPENELYYGACIWVLQNQESSVVAENNTFNGNHAIAFNLGQGTTLEESGNTDNTKTLKVKVKDGAMYYTLAEAIASIESEGTIKVCQSFESEAVTIPAGKTITLDLNGKTITGIDNSTASFGLITNKGNLTVQGNGKMTLEAKNNRAWNAYSSVISNTVGGNLVVKEATIEHLGGTDMAYGIDNLTNGKNTYAETTINDGAVVKSTYRAIRQFLNGIEAQNILTINGGTIEGANKSIWMQDPSKNANTGKLEVKEAATLKGDVYLFVTAGSTEWPVEVSIAASSLVEGAEVITGNVPNGYDVLNVNGNWTVIKYTTVSTADELVAALAAGKDVLFMNDITVPATKGGYEKAGILQNKAQTIDGNGYTLTVTGAGSTWSCAIYTNGGIIKNLTVAGAMRGIFTAGQSSDLHIDNVVFKNVIYTFNSDGKMPANPYGVYVSNSVVNGWTSHSNMHTEVVYTDCSFGEGSGYKFCRPYGKTEFVNCTFCPGYSVDKSKTNEITFTNCTFEE